MSLMRKMKYINRFLLLLVLLSSILISCESMLEIKPEDSKVREEFWHVKEDVEASIIGCYDGIKGQLYTMFCWGEIRGELVEVRSSDASVNSFNLHFINQTMGLTKWNGFYSNINRANTVIKFAPVAFESDDTYSKTELGYDLGECLTLKALNYFYLVRSFKELPYTSEPSENDKQNYLLKPLSGEQVVDSILKDLHVAEKLVRHNYNDRDFEDVNLLPAYNKGRITLSTVHALMTDVYLFKNDYANALKYANLVLSNNDYKLLDGENWYEMFSPGNSSEGIFELQFSTKYKYTNDLQKWFSDSEGGSQTFMNRLNQSTGTYKLWEGDDEEDLYEEDLRGQYNTYRAEEKDVIWKYSGSSTDQDDYRTSSDRDQNWIFYRLADVVLMKAEALNRLGRSDEAVVELLKVRNRAGYEEEGIVYASVKDLELMILDERGRELAFEGKRWFDLVRISRRNNDPNILARRIAEATFGFGGGQSSILARLVDPDSWYLPIHQSELELNPNLKQNPYYRY
ncbi:RagB/SusD family nutrient uptake outer membrane protein [Prolixibacteraceae bacterium JC049]|nr:RagB/SusD family nutrient uptake outer membrane protein [Prolixibacteraceae bacterium JC049]